MKITVLSTLLLGCLLVMTVQGDSSERVLIPPGKEGNKNKLGVFAQKEPLSVRSGGAHMRKLGLGGRKFIAHEVTSKISGATYSDGICDFDEREGDHKIVKCKGEKSTIKPRKLKMDGKDNDGLKKSSGGSSRDKKNDDQKLGTMHMVPKEYLKSTKFVIPSSTNPKCTSQDCNAVTVKSSLGSSSSREQQISEEHPSKDEGQRFADAAREIANLIYKDYKGKPSHRPPINNHEPRN
ncbi:hypothetical protein Fmac_017344 [Flemingia macrophylla]|uniref:Uncharacterized protein n=1 Tax=Flemingia macrophylla TaxID=520843 RepID=A0ABD1M2J3_9FABA